MLIAKDLIGRWVSATPEKIVNPDDSVIYGIRDFILTEKAWAILFTAYGDEAAKLKLFTLRVEGTYELKEVASDIPGARHADFHFTSRYITAHAPMFVEMFENAKCGSGNWQIDVEQDVSLTGAVFIPSVAQAPVEYDLVKLDRDALYLGDRSHDLAVQRATQLTTFPVIRC